MKKVKVPLRDLVVLLFNMLRYMKKYGWEDAEHSFNDVYRNIYYYTFVKKSVLESLLHCSNLLNEEGKFYHPNNKSFNKVVEDCSTGYTFNQDFSLLEKNE